MILLLVTNILEHASITDDSKAFRNLFAMW